MKIGKRVFITATVGTHDKRLNKICLENLVIDGNTEKDHAWIHVSERFKDSKAIKGDRIQFRATIREYLGLGKDAKQEQKLGIHQLREIRRVNNEQI